MQSSLLGLFYNSISEIEVCQGVKIYEKKKKSSAVSDNCSCTRNVSVSEGEIISDGRNCQFLPPTLSSWFLPFSPWGDADGQNCPAGGFCRIKKVKPTWDHSLKADS